MAPGTRPYPGRTLAPGRGPGRAPGTRPGPGPGRAPGPGLRPGPGRPGPDPGPGRREITGRGGPGAAPENKAKGATYARKVAVLGPGTGPLSPSKLLEHTVPGRSPAQAKKYNPIRPGDCVSYFFGLFWAPFANPRAFAQTTGVVHIGDLVCGGFGREFGGKNGGAQQK